MAYSIGTYQIEDEDEAILAQKELQAITNIRKQLDITDLAAVQSTYEMLIQKDVFHTIVGLDFLKELKSIYTGKEKEAVYSEVDAASPKVKKKKSKRRISLERQVTMYRSRARFFTGTTMILFVIVIGMFIITSTSDQPNILNYEEKIVNKYAAWEQELTQREQELNEREQALDERE